MNGIANWWRRLGLRLRLQLLIQGALIVILGAAQAWISAQFEREVLDGAESRARAVADGAVNGLNTLMVTKVGSEDVISDPKARALFIKKTGEAEKILDMRIVRAKSMDNEYPPPLPQEQPVDELDRNVLASGKTEYTMIDHGDGKPAIRAVMPFINAKDFRGTDCTKCHGEDPGAVRRATPHLLCADCRGIGHPAALDQ